MKKNYIFAGLALLAAGPVFAQTKIGASGAPDASAMLEITAGTSNNKGLLLPRVTTVQRDAISLPATGLMIYNTTTNSVQVNIGTPASAIWVTTTPTANNWSINGNSGTTPANNFIGTVDNQPMVVRTNNVEKMRVTAAGNVGIGNNAPGAKLQVTDASDPTILVGNSSGGAGKLSLGNDNHGLMRDLTGSGGQINDVAVFTSAGSSGTGSLYLVANPAASGSGNLPLNQFVLTNAGKVGIGTNAPAAKLHVDTGGIRVSNGTAVLADPAIQVINDGGGPGNNDNIVINSYGTNTQPSIGTQSARGTFAAPQNSQAGDNIGNFFFNSRVNGATVNSNVIRSAYLGDGTTNKSRMNVYTSNTIALSIDSNQNVGLGTMSPQQTLHVAGTARITGSTGTAATITGRNAAGDISNVTVGTGLSLTGGTLSAAAGGNNWGITGNAGTNPANNFIGTTDNQPMVVRTNNAEKMRVTAAGNVGIGNSAPGVKLQVTDATDPIILVGNTSGGGGKLNLGNDNHGIFRGVPGGSQNDVVVYTSTGTVNGTTAALYLCANPKANGADSLPLNQFVLKNTGYVGIGTNTPAARLHVDTGGLRISNGPVALANPAVHVISDGGGSGNNDNIVISSYGTNTQPSIGTESFRGTFAAPQNSQPGDNIGNFFFNSRVNGSVANSNVIRGVYLGDGTTNKSRMNFFTSNTQRMTIDSNGYVGIGTAAPAYALHVIGDINASANVRANGVVLTSDARLKSNITNSGYGLNTVMDLRPVVYDKKNSIQETNYDRHEIGFIAQEIARVLPFIVTEGKDADKTLAVSYIELIPVLTKAIQEQQAEIAALKAALFTVNTNNTALKAEVSKLDAFTEKMEKLEALLSAKTASK